jgi:hypothetical protein
MHPRLQSGAVARPINVIVRCPMRSCLLTALLWIGFIATAVAADVKNDGSLDSIAWATATASDSCPVLLTANVVHNAGGYFLRFIMKNVSGRPLTFYRQTLPWGNVDSTLVAAVTTEGHLVPATYPIEDDFGTDKVTVRPNQTLKGDYDLSHRWNDKGDPPNGFPKGTTIVLMWAYKARPKEIPPTSWPTCSGVAAFKIS